MKIYIIQEVARYPMHNVYGDVIACFYSRIKARQWAEENGYDTVTRFRRHDIIAKEIIQ